MDPIIQGSPTDVILGITGVFTWGDSTGLENEGRTVRADIDPGAKEIELPDGNGIPTGAIIIPQMIKGPVEIEAQSTLAAPTMASKCFLGGVAVFLAKPAKQQWERGGISRYSLELRAFPAAGVAGWPGGGA